MHKRLAGCMLLCILFGMTACGQSDTEQLATKDLITAQQEEQITENDEEQISENDSAENSKEQDSKSDNADHVEEESGEDDMRLQVRDSAGNTILIQLNDSPAAKSLYDQLPLTIPVENYSSNEKIFYPPEKLSTSDTPMAEGGAGVIAYFEPWGNVVMYYGDFGKYPGLYELGNTISGAEHIESLAGEVQISKVE